MFVLFRYYIICMHMHMYRSPFHWVSGLYVAEVNGMLSTVNTAAS